MRRTPLTPQILYPGGVISAAGNWVVRVWRFTVDVGLRWYRTGIGDLAAGVTFWILVSLPASVLTLLAALGPLDQVVGGFGFQTKIETEVIDFTNRIFTDESGSIDRAVEELFRQSDPGLFTLSLALTLWSVSRGFAGLIRALDDIYEVNKRRTWYHARAVAIILGLGSLALSVPLIVADQLLFGAIPKGPVADIASNFFALIVLALWAATIYHYGPSQRSRWKHDLPGGLVAAALWLALSIGFARYGSVTSGVNEVRAAVGAGLLALTWLWLVAQILLIGGAVNYLLGKRRGHDRRRRVRNGNGSLNETINEKVVQRIASTTEELKALVDSDRKE